MHVRPEDEAYLRDVFELPRSSSRRCSRSRTSATRGAATAAPQPEPRTRLPVRLVVPPATAARHPPKRKPPVRSLLRRMRTTITAAVLARVDDRGWRTGAGDARMRRRIARRNTQRGSTASFGPMCSRVISTAGVARDVGANAGRAPRIDEELTRQVESLASKGAAALSAGIKGIASRIVCASSSARCSLVPRSARATTARTR
jgi:hypothetical protein